MFSPYASPISGHSMQCPFAWTLNASWHWQVGINPQQGSPFGGCLQSLWGTTKLYSRANYWLEAGHVSFMLLSHTHRHTAELIKYSRKLAYQESKELELQASLPCLEDPRWAPKMKGCCCKLCYAGIHDLQRRGIRFGARDQAWPLGAFCIMSFI